MPIAAQVIIAFVAALHIYILWLEIFAWESRGPKVFRAFPRALFAPTKGLAANQGLYNGFLAAGLIWALVEADVIVAAKVAAYILTCVAVAGACGAATVSRRIFFVQLLPAVLGLLALILL